MTLTHLIPLFPPSTSSRLLPFSEGRLTLSANKVSIHNRITYTRASYYCNSRILDRRNGKNHREGNEQRHDLMGD